MGKHMAAGSPVVLQVKKVMMQGRNITRSPSPRDSHNPTLGSPCGGHVGDMLVHDAGPVPAQRARFLSAQRVRDHALLLPTSPARRLPLWPPPPPRSW
jgi:hypothetical protein